MIGATPVFTPMVSPDSGGSEEDPSIEADQHH